MTNERVEEIRRHWEQQHAIREGMREKGVEPSPSWYDEEIPYLLTALARAERERERLEQQIIETSIRRAVAPAAEQADHMWANQSYVEENAELRAEVERLKKQHRKEISEVVSQAQDVSEQAEAALARVRGALEAILRPSFQSSMKRILEEHEQIARAALEGRG